MGGGDFILIFKNKIGPLLEVQWLLGSLLGVYDVKGPDDYTAEVDTLEQSSK